MELPDEVMIPEVTIPEVRVPRSIALPVVVGVIALGVGVGVGYVLGKLRNKRPYFQGTEAGDGDTSTEEGSRNSQAVRTEGTADVSGGLHGLSETDQLELSFEGDAPTVFEEDESSRMPELGYKEPSYTDRIGRPMIDDDWDYKKEAQNRTPNRPYIIHVDEFNNDEMDYPHMTLVYYQGDDVLCEQNGTQVPNRDIFGLLLFGHGSEDPNLVYVRNEKIECEYEIQLQPGHWGVEVLGLDEEIQHSRKPRKGKQHPKFRLE